VFGHFTELGESSRLYLLKAKQLGRILDIFFNGLNCKYAVASTGKVPLFLVQKEFYLESSTKECVLSVFEQKQIFA